MTTYGPNYDAIRLTGEQPNYTLFDSKLIFTHRAGIMCDQRTLQEGWHVQGNEFTATSVDVPAKESDLYKARWGVRAYGMREGRFEENKFRWIHKEHGLYLDVIGDMLIRRNHFDHCAAQGSQIVNRPNMVLPEWGDMHGAIQFVNNVYDHCGLWHGSGRAAFACSVFEGAQKVLLKHNKLIHNHNAGEWYSWRPDQNNQPGAIMVQGRPQALINQNQIDYQGMRSRPLILIKNIAGLARLSGNQFLHGGSHIDIMDCGDVVIARNEFLGEGAPPQVRVFDGDNILIHDAPVTEDWVS